MPLPLSPQVMAITTHLIEDCVGLHYDEADVSFLAEKLSERAAERGHGSLLDYYYFLRYDAEGPAELQLLAESLVIHETYLFREIEPLRILVRSVIPELLRGRPRIRIWSAACATGEEPYSLAVLLAQADLLDRVEIVASDLSDRALLRARAGEYRGRSLRSLGDLASHRPWLEESPAGVRVMPALRDKIDWRRVNLLDDAAIRAMGTFDVVLCRNVLIYFADATVTRVARTLASVLQPGGYLLVGASESLLRFGTFLTCEEHGGSFFYRKARE